MTESALYCPRQYVRNSVERSRITKFDLTTVMHDHNGASEIAVLMSSMRTRRPEMYIGPSRKGVEGRESTASVPPASHSRGRDATPASMRLRSQSAIRPLPCYAHDTRDRPAHDDGVESRASDVLLMRPVQQPRSRPARPLSARNRIRVHPPSPA